LTTTPSPDIHWQKKDFINNNKRGGPTEKPLTDQHGASDGPIPITLNTACAAVMRRSGQAFLGVPPASIACANGAPRSERRAATRRAQSDQQQHSGADQQQHGADKRAA